MTTVDQILKEEDNYSELSAEPSFTLEDILMEPPDEDILLFNHLEECIDDIDAFFEADQETPKPFDIINNMDEFFEEDPQEKNESQEKAEQKKEDTVQSKPSRIQTQKTQSKANGQDTIRKWARLQDYPMLPTEQIQNMVFISLKNVSELFDISESKGVGIPTCISATGSKFLAIGTSLGNSVIFEIGVKGNRKLNTEDQAKYGQVTTVAVSRDNRYLVSGYESGLIVVWDLISFKPIKKQLLHSNRIIKIVFCSENYQNFVSCDSQGLVYMFTIQNYLWAGVKHQLLVNKSDRIYNDMKYSKLINGKTVLLLCSTDSVLLLSIKPTIGALGSIERPADVKNTKIPNCQIGSYYYAFSKNKQEKDDIRDVLCVSWAKSLYFYKLVFSKQTLTEEIVLDYSLAHPSTIHNIEFINTGIIVTLDESQVYRVINLYDSKASEKCVIISTDQLEVETIYQRFLKDKSNKYIKSYSNTIVSCHFNPRHKEIFLIAKNSIFRGRLQKWTDYAHYLISEKNNWELALKLCIQLYKGNYNIFAEPFVISATSMDLICNIGKYFIKERMKAMALKNTEPSTITQVEAEARETFQETIQFYLSINSEGYLFGTIFPFIHDKFFYRYEEVLYECLEPFIENNLIKSIPNRQVFVVIVDKYSSKPAILNQLIINLDEESLNYEDVVEVCARQNLYESLCYICAVNGDFISPANKIIAHCKQTKSEEEVKKYYNVLVNYLLKLLDMKYPNNKPIKATQRLTLIPELSVWLGCDETLQFLIDCKFSEKGHSYFVILSALAEKIMEYDFTQDLPPLVENLLKNLEFIRSHNCTGMLLNFLIKSGLNKKIHYSQQLVKKIIDIYCEWSSSEDSEKQIELTPEEQLRFLQKYLLSDQVNYKENLEFFEANILSSINVWVKVGFMMLKGVDSSIVMENQSSILSSNNKYRNFKIGIVSYILESRDEKDVEQYLDIMIKWCPELTLIYMLDQDNGIAEVNEHIEKIEDEKLRYLIVRKILKFLRKKQKLNIHFEAKNSQKRQMKKKKSLNSVKLSQSIMVFYINEICKYKKEKRVFYELTQNPQDYYSVVNDLLPIIEKFQFKSCQAFLLEQLLKYRNAFDAYSIVYADEFNKNYIKLLNHENKHSRFMYKMYSIMLDLCYRIKKEDQWGRLLGAVFRPLQQSDPSGKKNERVVDIIQKLLQIKSMKTNPFMVDLVQIVQSAITSTSREISISVMAVELNKYTDLLNKSFIVNCLTTTLISCHKRVQTFETSRNLMVEQFACNFEQFFTKFKIRGVSLLNECSYCKLEPTNRSKLPLKSTEMVYECMRCGHGYHELCMRQICKQTVQCQICSRKQYGDPAITNSSTFQNTQNAEKHVAAKVDKEQIQRVNLENVYRSLAFDDYIKSRQENFAQFQSAYERYIDENRRD